MRACGRVCGCGVGVHACVRAFALVHNLGLAAWEKGAVDTVGLVKESLELVMQRGNLPALLCCSSGVGHCGLVVGCLRRMQVWCLASIFAE